MLLNQYDIECIQNDRTFIAGINTTKLRAAFKKLFNTGLHRYIKFGE
ncbi:MAG TPA: hypothetical protein VIJ95_17070 [Hanamia sp.]